MSNNIVIQTRLANYNGEKIYDMMC